MVWRIAAGKLVMGVGKRRTIPMAAGAIIRTGCVGVVVAPDVGAGGGDVAFVLVGGGDAYVAGGFEGWRESGGEGEEGRKHGDSKYLHD